MPLKQHSRKMRYITIVATKRNLVATTLCEAVHDEVFGRGPRLQSARFGKMYHLRINELFYDQLVTNYQ